VGFAVSLSSDDVKPLANGIMFEELTKRINLDQEFIHFQKQENIEWQKLEKTPEEWSRSMCPAGSINSAIAHHLHQPSFTTSFASNQTVEDESNGCIAMVMGNAYRKGETLLYDHLHRRSVKSDGLEQLPKIILHLHEQFIHRILGLSAAKVEFVYGQHVQKRILETMQSTILPLWGLFEKIFLVLIHKSNFGNKVEEYRFRKILMFATHPQRLFYEPHGSQVALQQDMSFQAAGLITEVGCEIDPMYYPLQKWYAKMPSLFERARQQAERLTIDLSLQVVQRTNPAPTEDVKNAYLTNQGVWDVNFSSEPHSNNKTRRLLPAAIAATKAAIKSNGPD
jgi:hypothetical protein